MGIKTGKLPYHGGKAYKFTRSIDAPRGRICIHIAKGNALNSMNYCQ